LLKTFFCVLSKIKTSNHLALLVIIFSSLAFYFLGGYLAFSFQAPLFQIFLPVVVTAVCFCLSIYVESVIRGGILIGFFVVVIVLLKTTKILNWPWYAVLFPLIVATLIAVVIEIVKHMPFHE